MAKSSDRNAFIEVNLDDLLILTGAVAVWLCDNPHAQMSATVNRVLTSVRARILERQGFGKMPEPLVAPEMQGPFD